MAEVFKLPSSSYEELLKLIQAYADSKEGVALSLDDINHATGVPRTVVSKNNGFLVQIGLITEGNKKAATETGRALGRAYASKIDYEVERIWKEIVSEVDFLSRMVSAVRIRNGMDRSNFINHVIYSSGQKDSKESRAGAGAIIEILKNVGILAEVDGKLTVVEEKVNHTESAQSDAKHGDLVNADSQETQVIPIAPHITNSGITINININCNVDELDELGEKLKSLLRSISD